MIFLILGTLLSGLGLLCLLSKGTFLGWLSGVQLLWMGLPLVFLIFGKESHLLQEVSFFIWFLLLSSFVWLGVGCVLGIRMYSIRKNLDLEKWKELRK